MKPFFSIIIPSRNKNGKIKFAIDSLKKLNYPKDRFEVIIVDSSDDRTRQTLKKIKDSNFRIFFREPAPKRDANILRNFGIKKSRWGNIILLDSDCIVDRNWLNDYADYIKDDIVGGSLIVRGQDFYSNYFNYSIRPLKLALSAEKAIDIENFNKGNFPLGGNFRIKKSVLRKVGYFDEDAPSFDEMELFYRVLSKGYKIKLIPGARVRTTHVSKFKDILKNYFRFGKGFAYFSFKHKRTFYIKSRLLQFFAIDSIVLSLIYLSIHLLFVGLIFFSLIFLLLSFYYKMFVYRKGFMEIPVFVLLDIFLLGFVYQFSSFLYIIKSFLKGLF